VYLAEKLDRGFDRAIYVLGADHHGTSKWYAAIADMLGYEPDRVEVLLYQFVHLTRGGEASKMSKRAGDIVTLEEFMDEVGVDAARWYLVNRGPDTAIEIDVDLAAEKTQKNPVYYVQYAHARVRSIWRQIAEQGLEVPPWSDVSLAALGLPEELAIMKRLVEYPALVAGAARALEPHRLAYWLHELAGLFHPYYKSHRVIQPDRELMLARLALCTAVAEILRSGLGLLGVSAPEAMTREIETG